MMPDTAPVDALSTGLLNSGLDDAPCIRDDHSGWITRAALRRSVHEVAALISEASPGLAFLFASNDVATVVGLLAGFSARVPVALLDPSLSPEAVERLVALYQPEIVLGRDIAAANRNYRNVPLGSSIDTPIINLARKRAGAAVHPSLALLLSTSGSTGSPKFVRLAQSAVLCNARQISEALAIERSDIGIAHLPMHYSYGMSIVTSHFLAGAAVSLMTTRVTDPTFWQRISEDSATHFPGVPFHYSVIDRLGINRIVPPSVRTFTQAGGHLDHQTRVRCYNAISERGGRFYVMYGQTEAGPRITTLQSDDFSNHSQSVGQALEGGKLYIVDDEGAPLSAGIEGNVIYEGPNVMMGYACSRSDLMVDDEQKGRLETGDRAILSADGFLTLTGRTQRFAKIAGLRIALDEIESYFISSGSVAALSFGEKIVLYVDKSAEVRVSQLAPKLARQMGLPSAVFVRRSVESLPLKSNGKVDYKALEQLA